MFIRSLFISFLFMVYACMHLHADMMSAVLLPSTESDPDAFIGRCCNAINGDYCEVATDLTIAGPDALVLQRYYNAKNYVTGQETGGWRIFPQTLLVVGRGPQNKECKVGQDRFEWAYAFTGERSGGILTYSGWKKIGGDSKDPLKIDLKDTTGMVNSYAGAMSGQTNHLNNRMQFKQDTCELILGDGTKRVYKKVEVVPVEIFGEEIAVALASKVIQPQYYQLVSETLPSGNIICFSYESHGHLASVEIKNGSQKKLHAWMQFVYDFSDQGCCIKVSTSDEKTLTYNFERILLGKQSFFILKEVKGSHAIPCSYDYKVKDNVCFLTCKHLPKGRFLAVEYDDKGRVKVLKGPEATTGKPENIQRFVYGDRFTEVFNADDIKTCYRFDDRFQLVAVECYDQSGKLYRTDRKSYGKSKLDQTCLLARIISDGEGGVHSYRCFKYDSRGNVLEEKLYGNLTGKKEVALQIDANEELINPDAEECHPKTFSYSEDGLNLVTCLGDAKGNKTTFHYCKNTSRLIRKFIYEKDQMKKSELRFYNTDGVCVKIIEDDGYRYDVEELLAYDVTERHIREIRPKENLPGVGLPEIIEEKAVDFNLKKEMLVKKLVNKYSPQGHLLFCETYDASNAYAYTVGKTYNHLGQVTSEIDPEGKTTTYSYDDLGNQILISIPHQKNKTIEKRYDFQNNLTQTIERAGTLQAIQESTYDRLNRQTTSTDQFGQTTTYTYDSFGRLTKIIYPTVLDEYEKPIQPTFSYTYDIFGNVLMITDPKGYTTHKDYNLRGSPTKVHYPDGTNEMFKYDTEGTLHRSLTRNHIITVYEYDYLGRVSYEEDSFVAESGEPFIKGREYTYNGFRCTRSRIRYLKEADIVTDFQHDPTGRVISIITQPKNDIQSRKTEIVYDSLGRESKKKVWFDIGPADYWTECFEYDLLGNKIEKRIENSSGKILMRKGVAYDDSGRCTEEFAFPNGQKQTFVKTSYNPFGEIISCADALGNETQIIIDYSKNVLSKKIISPEGVQTTIEFDALGRVVSTIKKDSRNAPLSSQAIFYDGVGNKSLEINTVIANGKEIGLQKTRWVYGPMGRLEELIEAEGTSEEKRTTYFYNSLGQMNAKLLPGALAPLTYTYGEEGWLEQVRYEEGKKGPVLFQSYFYDKRGNITSATALNDQSIERIYNDFHQVVQETVKDGKSEYSLKMQYDRVGRPKSITLPDASAIAYTYDGIFAREIRRLSPQGEELYVHTYGAYDVSGRLLEETLIGYCGDRRTRYDTNGRKIFVETDYYSETVPEGGYSAQGNLLAIHKKGDFPINDGIYTYSALSQLSSEKNGISNTYAYDSIDNRLRGNKEDLRYNSLNQLIAKAKAEYTYDLQGNLLRKTLDGEETSYNSNILSQLISVEQPDKTVLNFSYDPFGRRMVKTIYDSKEKNKKILSKIRSFYMGHHELGILDEKGVVKKLRIPGISGNEMSPKSVAIEINGQAYAVLHDFSGNVCALVDPATRDIVESYTYSAFGNEQIYNSSQRLIPRSAIGNHWRYAEKPIDEETGLVYFGFRYYDPTIGRWISQDPSGFIDGPNLYAYCHNNPLNFFDRFGLESEPAKVKDEYFYGEVEDHCYCDTHRTCKRGGDLDETMGSCLPTISYCDNFEKMYPEYESSQLYDLGLKEMKNIAIGFINGIWNDFEDAAASAQYVSKLADGYNIHAVYNATHGSADLKECRMGLNYVATKPVRLLQKMWNSYFEKNSADAKFLMICHSQGAIHVRNALLDYPSELRDRIMVVAIAPAAYIYKETCAHVIHYRVNTELRDPVPYAFDQKGAEREKGTIINLPSHFSANLLDHNFDSPTYEKIISQHLSEYLNSGRLK